MANTHNSWDQECDVLVVGSGGGAFTGAYGAAARGLDTLVIEKTGYFGGTTAYAGAGLWLPGNPAQVRGGLKDSADLGRAYFRSVVGDATAPRRARACVERLRHLHHDAVVLLGHRTRAAQQQRGMRGRRRLVVGEAAGGEDGAAPGPYGDPLPPKRRRARPRFVLAGHQPPRECPSRSVGAAYFVPE
ncbi:FAD-binding protein [Streptomyces sp. NPDC057543]|uniref:FAD-binding protein n=1 Tax=Streptomyces sp. NPDC057543 TaxID=3346163 RepID=UPI0036AFED74